jgi:hypothetical protein
MARIRDRLIDSLKRNTIPTQSSLSLDKENWDKIVCSWAATPGKVTRPYSHKPLLPLDPDCDASKAMIPSVVSKQPGGSRLKMRSNLNP